MGIQARFFMPIDYTLVSGPRDGLTFDFVPSHDSAYEGGRYFADRNGPDVFSITENAFLFLEKAVADAYPDWNKGYYYGVNYLPAETWLTIFENLHTLRQDIHSGINPTAFLEKHLPNRAPLTILGASDFLALRDFLEQFEHRVRELMTRYTYLAIGGI